MIRVSASTYGAGVRAGAVARARLDGVPPYALGCIVNNAFALLTPAMTAVRTDLGRRTELVSMDSHHHDISVGLYVRETAAGPVGAVHSYSGRPGTAERLAQIAGAMRALGGLDEGGDGVEVRFPCQTWHHAAAKRLFLEACKHDPSTPLTASPLAVPDTRSDQRITVIASGEGVYDVLAEGATAEVPSRAPAIARAMAKLAQLRLRGEDGTSVAFPCGHRHDQLVALLLGRAQNLRQILREEELQSSRGVLAAPSAQE